MPPTPEPPPPPAPAVPAGAAAALVGALAKAARAFTLYDPSNAVVRRFLAEYRARAEEATRDADVEVEVRPFELRVGSEVAYAEEDRERSLAFRLFRDGVRRITFGRGVAFDDLLRLLEILALRAVGVRDAEDDTVTLLRRADLKTIAVVAVEGYAPDEALPEPGAEREGRPGPAGSGAAPPDFDQPLPPLVAAGPLAWREVTGAELVALRTEELPEAVAPGGVRAARELVGLAEAGELTADDVGRFVAELRAWLVADAQLAPLVELARLAEGQPPGPLRDALLRALADPRLVAVLLARVPAGAEALGPELAPLVALLPAEALLDRLAAGGDGAGGALLVELAAARLPADADAVVARLPALPAEAARSLSRAVAARAPARLADVVCAALRHPDPALRSDALRAAGALPRGIPAAALTPLLGDAEEGVRIAAARVLERHGDAASARAVAEALQRGQAASDAEADALGRTLGRLNPPAALRLFEEWLEARTGLLRRLTGADQRATLRRAALSGLEVTPGAEAERLLERAARREEEPLRVHARGVLARRRAEAARRG